MKKLESYEEMMDRLIRSEELDKWVEEEEKKIANARIANGKKDHPTLFKDIEFK